ncbi:19724_t:CDS:2, partial [Gigaspora margarita]
MKSHEEKKKYNSPKNCDEAVNERTTLLKTSSRKKVRFPEKLCNEAINEKTAPAVKRHNTNKEENLPGWMTPTTRSHEEKSTIKTENI